MAARTGQADNEADNGRKNRREIPANRDVLRLAKKIKRELRPGRTKIDIARDFTESNERKAKSLLRELRRFPYLLD